MLSWSGGSRLLFAGATVALFTAAATSGGKIRHAPEAISTYFQKPSELPKDVFDLPEFDADRTGGVLNLEKAKKELEDLSDSDLPEAQRRFDILAWKAFVALNWPTRDGKADAGAEVKDIGGNAKLVWESWKQTSDIFKSDGSKPSPWGEVSEAVADRFKAGWKQNTTVDQGLQAFSGPLVDQDGRWLHYQALVDHPEFDYIVENKLYNLEGQAEFAKNSVVSFPEGDDHTNGAIEIKLAWKILNPDKDTYSRFLRRKLTVIEHVPDSAVLPGAPSPAELTGKSSDNINSTVKMSERKMTLELGLVGMHISMRTRSSPQWIWATFEQIDNTRLDPYSFDDAHPAPKRGHPSLSNPDAPEKLIGANVLPPTNAVDKNGMPISDWDERTLNTPIETLRLVPPPQGTAKVNREIQAFLGAHASVLRYYELNGTQWPTHPKNPAAAGGQGSAPESISHKMPGSVVPVYLVNSTMETYFQKGFQQAGPLEQDDRVPFSIDTTMVFGTESCVGCHYSAGICIRFKKDSYGRPVIDPQTNLPTPVFGENDNGGRNGNGNFSWMLQIEAKHDLSLEANKKLLNKEKN